VVYRDYLKQYCELLESHIPNIRNIQKDYDISQSFVILQNRACITLEISNLFLKHFVPANIPIEPDIQIQRRLIYTFRDILFIGTLSTVEFCLRTFLVRYPETAVIETLLKRGVKEPRYIHFSSIIDELHRDGRINDKSLWDFSIQLRNDIVHNDSVGRKGMESPPMEYPIIMKTGEEARATLRSFVSITQSIENDYYAAITKLIGILD